MIKYIKKINSVLTLNKTIEKYLLEGRVRWSGLDDHASKFRNIIKKLLFTGDLKCMDFWEETCF